MSWLLQWTMLNTMVPNLQPRGLWTIIKVYDNRIFQGFLEKNNLWNKSSFGWHLLFFKSQASLLTCQFPFLPPLPQFFHPCYGFIQSTLHLCHIHFLQPNINFNIINGILTCFIHFMVKTCVIKGWKKL